MDFAYEHIQEEAYAGQPPKSEQSQSSLNNDIQDAYKAFSASPWGARIGGFFGNVVKQGESVYSQASKELAEVGEDASKGLSDLKETLLNRTRSLSLNAEPGTPGESSRSISTEKASEPPKDSAQEADTVLSRLRAEAAKRLKDLQRAEDAADEALLKFGSNVRDFLRDAISVAPPDSSDQGNTILFESKDAQGKRVIHTSRFDAQIYVIHTSPDNFLKNPSGPEYEEWTKAFDVEKQTTNISTDLDKYPDLRSTMENLVPDKVSYADFWKRYYFLRQSVEAAESRRRDLMKAAAQDDEVGWGDESDEEDNSHKQENIQRAGSAASSTTIHPPANKLLKPKAKQQSNDEKSQADSEASYDVVDAQSGLPSQAASSPKEPKKEDDSDEDWE